MAFDIAGMIDEITEVVADTWTDTSPGGGGGGIWEASQIEARSFEEIGGFPYAVVEIPETVDVEFGIVNAVQLGLLSLHYVAMESATLSTIWAKIEALKSAMFQATFTGMTVLNLDGLDWSALHPSNEIFLAKKVPYRAGSLTMRIIFGESAL